MVIFELIFCAFLWDLLFGLRYSQCVEYINAEFPVILNYDIVMM